jgi:hypothetical protein
MAAAFSFKVADLPAGLRFDGAMPAGEDRTFLQFTELDRQSASHGASFYIDAREALLSAIVARREEKRIQFSTGKTGAA